MFKKKKMQSVFKNIVQDALLSSKNIIIIDTIMTVYCTQFDN